MLLRPVLICCTAFCPLLALLRRPPMSDIRPLSRVTRTSARRLVGLRFSVVPRPGPYMAWDRGQELKWPPSHVPRHFRRTAQWECRVMCFRNPIQNHHLTDVWSTISPLLKALTRRRPASLLLIRRVAATSRTVSASANSAAARLRTGDTRSCEDQRMPSRLSATNDSRLASKGSAPAPSTWFRSFSKCISKRAPCWCE
jgi:hypothetical protein